MTIAEFHRLFKLVADKNGSDYFSHEEIDDFAHVAQIDYFAMLCGNYRQYQAGRPVPIAIVGQTSRTNEEINPFKTRIDFFSTPYDPTTAPYGVTDGFLALPLDYEHMDSVVSVVLQNGARRDRPVQELDGEEWAERVDSSLMPPSNANAIYRFAGKGGSLNATNIGERQKLEFRPKALSGYVEYYRTPKRPLYSYTLNATTGVETHNPAASTDLEWGEAAAMNILIRALQLAGIKSADQLLLSATSSIKNMEE